MRPPSGKAFSAASHIRRCTYMYSRLTILCTVPVRFLVKQFSRRITSTANDRNGPPRSASSSRSARQLWRRSVLATPQPSGRLHTYITLQQGVVDCLDQGPFQDSYLKGKSRLHPRRCKRKAPCFRTARGPFQIRERSEFDCISAQLRWQAAC